MAEGIRKDVLTPVENAHRDANDSLYSVKNDIADVVASEENDVAYSPPSAESDGTLPASSPDSDEERRDSASSSNTDSDVSIKDDKLYREETARRNIFHPTQDSLTQSGRRKRVHQTEATCQQSIANQQQQQQQQQQTEGYYIPGAIQVMDSIEQVQEEQMDTTEEAATSSQGRKRTKPQLAAPQMAQSSEAQTREEDGISLRKQRRKE